MGVGQFFVLRASLCEEGTRYTPEARLTSFCYFSFNCVCTYMLTCVYACVHVHACSSV